MLGFLAVTSGFLRRLPADTRRRFLVAGFIYVSGSLGLEMLGGNYEFVQGKRDLAFGLLGVAEETCEMLGTILFLRALLLYLSRRISHSGTCADDELIA